jgi:hypothetical protein
MGAAFRENQAMLPDGTQLENVARLELSARALFCHGEVVLLVVAQFQQWSKFSTG